MNWPCTMPTIPCNNYPTHGVEGANYLSSKGDKAKHFPFDKPNDGDLLTTEIEVALSPWREVDLLCAPCKTCQPHNQTAQLWLVFPRESPAEWLLMRKRPAAGRSTFFLKRKSDSGAPPPRRKAQMFDFRPDAVFKEMTGNESDCLENLRMGNFDAIILAGKNINFFWV
ncbi:MAG: hypothetical protein R2825_09290 [Saprospiraceae bacterium]